VRAQQSVVEKVCDAKFRSPKENGKKNSLKLGQSFVVNGEASQIQRAGPGGLYLAAAFGPAAGP
jgi:hypothetical protein